MKRFPYLLVAILFATLSISVSAQINTATFKRPTIANSNPYHNTDVLIDSKNHTILPKRCILFTPEKLATRVTTTRTKGFVVWPTFYLRNSSWIHTYEVTIEEAKGLKPIDSARIKRLQQLGKIIVAVYKRNPISVLPLKEKNVTPQ